MASFAFVILGFLCGSLPFSVWAGKLLLRTDIRRLGDGNPGAANVFKSGNALVGMLALLLDVSKAAVPVGLAYFYWDIRGVPMFLVAAAPVLGHAFSPFLGFKGGKAIAAVLGVWIGLTLWKASLAGVLAVVIGIAVLTPPGWAVMVGLGGILIALILWMPDAMLFSVLFGHVCILAWTHRADLSHRPRVRPWLAKLLHSAREGEMHGRTYHP